MIYMRSVTPLLTPDPTPHPDKGNTLSTPSFDNAH